MRENNLLVYFGNLSDSSKKSELLNFISNKSRLFDYLNRRMVLFCSIVPDENTIAVELEANNQNRTMDGG